jgi:hypothetical protein
MPVVVDPAAALRTGLGVSRTPYGFLIDREGVIRMKGVISERGHLEGLINRRGRYLGSNVWQVDTQVDTEEADAAPAAAA